MRGKHAPPAKKTDGFGFELPIANELQKSPPTLEIRSAYVRSSGVRDLTLASVLPICNQLAKMDRRHRHRLHPETPFRVQSLGPQRRPLMSAMQSWSKKRKKTGPAA